MFATTQGRARGAWAWGGALALLLALPGRAGAVDVPPGKMARQIDVMERILDQVLIDSPNFMISGRGNARGLYVKEFGVILSCDASLVEKDHKFEWGKDDFKIIERDGKKVIVIPDRGEDEEDTRPTKDDRERSREETQQERLYKRGKAELVDTLLDYGDTLSTLEAGKWVAIVASLHDARYFDERGMSRLILQAKIDDLRLFATDKLSEEETVKRIVEKEY
jgi:hypothetical protein